MNVARVAGLAAEVPPEPADVLVEAVLAEAPADGAAELEADGGPVLVEVPLVEADAPGRLEADVLVEVHAGAAVPA